MGEISTSSYLKAAKRATKWLLGRSKDEAKPGERSKKAKGWRIDGSNVSQTLDQVVLRLNADDVRRLLVQGDRDFLEQVKAAMPSAAITWSSCNFDEVVAGAANPDGVDYNGIDAVICGGTQNATAFRHAVARMAAFDPSKPIHWVGENWEFCGGMLPAPAGVNDCEALLFNHFQHFFGIKDPLQYRIELMLGDERKHFYRILKPNESALIRFSDYFKKLDRPGCIHTYVSHPILTRGRHYRLRVCADVSWQDSFTTLHSSHQYNMSPDYKFEYRLARDLLREGEVALTLPNYARDLGSDRNVRYTDGGAEQIKERQQNFYLDEVRMTKPAQQDGRCFGWEYSGYGGSFWYAFEPGNACQPGHRGSLSSNHYSSVPVKDRAGWPADEAEIARYKALKEAGYILSPYSVPITHGEGGLRFGFNFDGANPYFDQYLLYFFDGAGKLLGEMPYRKAATGVAFPDEVLAAWSHPRKQEARLAVVTPDWIATGIRYKGFKQESNLIVEDIKTGDRDVTEFQTSWRNCGVMVDGLPHFAGPSATVFSRTNLFGRARCDRGYRTGVLVVNGSGWLGHKEPASVEFTVRALSGEGRSGSVQIPAFCWRIVWLDEVIGGLAEHLGQAGWGSLLVQSPFNDFNCQLLSRNATGGVSLQHMWAY